MADPGSSGSRASLGGLGGEVAEVTPRRRAWWGETVVGRGGGGEVARGDGRGSGGWGGGGGRWSTRCRGGNDAASRCWRRRVTRRWRVPEPGAATAPLDRPKHEPHATLHGRWRPSRTDGPNEVNRAEHRPSDGRRCSACQVPTPETRTRAPLARSTHPCSRAVCRSNELVLANDQVEETGVALMVTGALTDCSSALPRARTITN